MSFDGGRATEEFRKQAQLAEALYRSKLAALGGSTQAATGLDEIVAMWSLFAYLSMIPAPPNRLEMLKALRRCAGPRPDRPQAPVFRESLYSSHRDRLLATLIERFEKEGDPTPFVARPGRREAG